MKKSCANCKFTDLDVTDMPCAVCTQIGDGDKNYFTPARPKRKELEAELSDWKREYDYQQQRACDAEAQLTTANAELESMHRELAAAIQQAADRQAIIEVQKRELKTALGLAHRGKELTLEARAECTRLDDKSVGWKYRHDSEERWAELYFKQRNEARRVAAKFYKELQWHRGIQRQNMENLKSVAENCSE